MASTGSFPTEVMFTRSKSVPQGGIEQLIRSTQVSFSAALYRFNSQRLARALDEAQRRGVRLRMVIDRNKYEESSAHPGSHGGGGAKTLYQPRNSG